MGQIIFKFITLFFLPLVPAPQGTFLSSVGIMVVELVLDPPTKHETHVPEFTASMAPPSKNSIYTT